VAGGNHIDETSTWKRESNSLPLERGIPTTKSLKGSTPRPTGMDVIDQSFHIDPSSPSKNFTPFTKLHRFLSRKWKRTSLKCETGGLATVRFL